MQILQIVHQYPPDAIGGTELYTRSLSQELATRGHEVTVFYRRSAEGSGMEERTEDSGVRVWAAWSGHLSANRRFLATFAEKRLAAMFQNLLSRVRPEVVHIQHLMGLPIDLVHQIRQIECPIVVTLHDYWWLCANAQLLTNYSRETCSGPELWLNCGRCAVARAGVGAQSNLAERSSAVQPGNVARWLAAAPAPLLAYRHWQLKQALLAARRLIAPSNFVRDTYARLGIPSGKISVVPHGIKTPEVSFGTGDQPGPTTSWVDARQHRVERLDEGQPAGAATISRPDASRRNRLRLAYIGGLAWQKGVHILIQAANELPREEFSLAIFGDTTAFPDYVAELRALIDHPGITLCGPIPHAGIWGVLAEVDAIVVPSLWYETASLITQEAFAAGVPVVASNIGALGEKITHEVDGLLVPAGAVAALRDTLLRLLQPPLLAQLRAGIRPVRQLTDHVPEIEEIYRLASDAS